MLTGGTSTSCCAGRLIGSGARSSISLTPLQTLTAMVLLSVSLRDKLDLSTPSGRLMFQIIGAMAEFERSLIQERVRAGLRNAKLRRLGRPPLALDCDRIARLRAFGASIREISAQLEVSTATVHKVLQQH
jgi:DNA invertase Pin-like site-specific DNA recombinase